MRVVGFNVRSLRDDPAGVADALRALAPDLVCVQEAPRFGVWPVSRARLARRAGLAVLTPERACGNLLLGGSGVVVRSTAVVRLPRRPGLHRRAAACAAVEVDGRPLTLACTHLDLDPAARLDSARRVRAALPPGPLVLCADVNDEPGSPPWEALASGLTSAPDGPTFPSRDPHRRIDAVLVGPELEVLDAAVEPTGLVTDHLAVRADLRWR